MKSRAFTLIELLVVIAIIAILSAIVLASLNSAREKGREASIRSTLKSMSNQIELMRADNPNYSFVNTCNSSSNELHKFTDAMATEGATVRCFSQNYYGIDVYARWGVTAEIAGAADLTAWSASPQGVVKWDTTDISGSTMNWPSATSACTSQGKRLPSEEELVSLDKILHPLPGFQVASYWSGTEYNYPSAPNFVLYIDSTGSTPARPKSDLYYVRCVS